MIYSLRLQILLSMVAVILITVGMTAFLAGQAANAEIERVQGRDDTLRNRRLGLLLAQQYAERQSWLEAQGLLEGAGAMYGHRVVLTNNLGVVVADTHRMMMGRRLDRRVASRAAFPVSGPNGYLGTVMVNPDLPARPSSSTIASIEPPGPPLNLLLVLSGLLAVAVALVLTFFLSRRVVAPVESLAKVAHMVAQRDFSTRADVGSRDEVGELARRFNDMVGELERTEELRRNMVADLAHELRTPLTNIRGYIEGISDGVIKPDPDTLDSMQGEVVLLTRLIEDLQDLALAESGRLQLQTKESDLSQLVRNAAAAFQQQAQVKAISLDVAASEPVVFHCDEGRISQIIRNLLSNAIAYTPSHGRVTATSIIDDGQAVLLVRNNGPGIPADDIPYVFERFYRVDRSRSRYTGGIGLGLTIARRLAEAHGGDISVTSEEGHWTEFKVVFPVKGTDARDQIDRPANLE